MGEAEDFGGGETGGVSLVAGAGCDGSPWGAGGATAAAGLGAFFKTLADLSAEAWRGDEPDRESRGGGGHKSMHDGLNDKHPGESRHPAACD